MGRGSLQVSKAFQKVLQVFPFPATYLCEAGFSLGTLIKTKYDSAASVEADWRIRLPFVTADVKETCKI